ncbi:MAG: DUF6588 family protein [Candidatus Cloacimonadota bacterium]|nr:DUF6588 family protein [Candidatus Cloacimonadota bacterium]
MKKLIILIMILIIVNITLNAEDDLSGSLINLYQDIGEAYTKPIVTGFGTTINSGWFHDSAREVDLGLDLEYGFVVMGSFFPESEKTFEATGDIKFGRNDAETLTTFLFGDSLQYLQDYLIETIMAQNIEVGIYGPTIVGSAEDSIYIVFPEQDFIIIVPETGDEIPITVPEQIIVIPVGGVLEELTMLPYFTTQLSIGTLYGTKFIFRFIPVSENEDEMGNFGYFGIGIQHNPNSWLHKDLPIDISASLFTQMLSIGDILTVESTALGINISKKLGYKWLNFTPYGGILLENTITKVKYDFNYVNYIGEEEVHKIRFEIEGENTGRITIGASFRIAFINANIDYNIGNYKSISGGLGFALTF